MSTPMYVRLLVHTTAAAVLASGLTVVTAGVGYAHGMAAATGRQAAALVDAATPPTKDTWLMDESSGTTMLDATGDHPGQLHNITLGRPGVSGSAYGFNGTSSYVRIPHAVDLNALGRDVHIAFDLLTTTVPAVPDYDLFRKGQAPSTEYKVEMQPNGSVTCYFKGDLGSATATSVAGLHDGTWHHIVCEKHATSVVLTVDGVKYTSSKSVGSIANTYDMIIGAYPTGDFYRGAMDEVTFSIDGDAAPPPTASFSASTISGTAPLPVSFTDSSSGSPTTWSWTFGDGGTSTARNPSHTFAAPGTYTVALKASNASGSDTVTGIVAVRDGVAPKGSYTVSPGSVQTLGPVTLTQTSLSDDFTPVQSIVRRVDWGDGSSVSVWSSGTSITHGYATAGSFVPSVQLTDTAGNTRVVAATAVTVTTPVVPPPPVVSPPSPLIVPPPLVVDTTAPSVRLFAPTARPHSVSSWRVLRGRASDTFSGVRVVRLRLVERRNHHWFAYRPRTHTWVRAASRDAALRRAGVAHIVPTDVGAWNFHVSRLRIGLLVGRFTAVDRAGNASGVHAFRARLLRS